MFLVPKVLPNSWITQFRVDLHQVHANNISLIDQSTHNMASLSMRKSIPESGASLRRNSRVNSIDIVRNMEGGLSIGIQILNGPSHHFTNAKLIDVLHRKAFYPML